MLAADNGHMDTVNTLAGTHNANVEAVDHEGKTALTFDVEKGLTEIVNTVRPMTLSLDANPQGSDSKLTQAHPCTICLHNCPEVRFDPCGPTACRSCSRELRKRDGATATGATSPYLECRTSSCKPAWSLSYRPIRLGICHVDPTQGMSVPLSKT
jgi:hypothetical protein